jgi:hypothetical protein
MELPIKSPSNKRPFGVSIIILIDIAYALLLAIVFYLSINPQLSINELQLMNNITNYYQFSILLILGVIIQLVIAIGLWGLQRWAWLLLILWIGLEMILNLWQYFNFQHLQALSMIIDVIIVFYMNQREVKKAFSGKTFMGAKWTT